MLFLVETMNDEDLRQHMEQLSKKVSDARKAMDHARLDLIDLKSTRSSAFATIELCRFSQEYMSEMENVFIIMNIEHIGSSRTFHTKELLKQVQDQRNISQHVYWSGITDFKYVVDTFPVQGFSREFADNELNKLISDSSSKIKEYDVEISKANVNDYFWSKAYGRAHFVLSTYD